MKKRVLTGINTTGTLHIGNYVGAIRPAIQDSKNPDVQSFFFMADLHASSSARTLTASNAAACRSPLRGLPQASILNASCSIDRATFLKFRSSTGC